jgi:hypothetical protein
LLHAWTLAASIALLLLAVVLGFGVTAAGRYGLDTRTPRSVTELLGNDSRTARRPVEDGAVQDRRPYPATDRPQLMTIPSSDRAFRDHVAGIHGDALTPGELERRLRRIFPRVVVRERSLSGEPAAWYVYRDGGWRSGGDGDWWAHPSLPRVVVSAEGWMTSATPTAAGLLGIDPADVGEYHFTDFVVPGTLDDAVSLFRVIEAGNNLTATILLRPTSGDVIAVELHAARHGTSVVGVLRLASDVEIAAEPAEIQRPATVRTIPATDVAFRGYVLRAIERMPEPTPGGLSLRVRRLYPHASTRAEGDDVWTVRRDPGASDSPTTAWWLDDALPRVRYDAQALILEANAAARTFLGHDLVGHHWQEFVTPGSTEEVGVMLEILRDVGAAESRFRMPRSDGTLVEFDSYTSADGEEFVTVMRPA